jgi:hypothetical protein
MACLPQRLKSCHTLTFTLFTLTVSNIHPRFGAPKAHGHFLAVKDSVRLILVEFIKKIQLWLNIVLKIAGERV